GWHLFIRGWRFFLSGPPPGAPAVIAASSLGTGTILVRIVTPMLVMFLLTFGLLLRFGGRREGREPSGGGLRRLLLHLGVTIAGGYALFVAANALLWAGHVIHGTLLEAATEGALLTFVVVVPGFLALTALSRLVPRRKS